MYAINHDLPSGLASQLSQITIAVIMLSILGPRPERQTDHGPLLAPAQEQSRLTALA